MIRVGQVAGAFGLDGAVKVIPLTDFQDRFDPGTSLLLDGGQHQVEWSRESQPGLVVKLRGIDNRTMAELFRGRYLELPDDQMRPLEQGRFYHRQVVGLSVMTFQLSPFSRIALKSRGAYAIFKCGVSSALPFSWRESTADATRPVVSSVRSMGYGDSFARKCA